jgi:hypothetical protein
MSIAAQLRNLNTSVEISTKAREFCNLARIVAMSRGDDAHAQHIAEETRLSPTIRSILSGRPAVYAIHPAAAASQKAAISAGTTTDGGWAVEPDGLTLASGSDINVEAPIYLTGDLNLAMKMMNMFKIK